jgi:hypothetical protein
MNLATHKLLLIWPLLLAGCSSEFAQNIDIRGIQIGMSQEEVDEKVGPKKDFTIAGVKSMYSEIALRTEYRNGKLDQLTFYFDPRRFDVMLQAVKEKYPRVACEDIPIPGAKDASFKQTRCFVSDEVATLQLIRFVIDARTSALKLLSKQAIEEAAGKDSKGASPKEADQGAAAGSDGPKDDRL